jgi:hypothetical protein
VGQETDEEEKDVEEEIMKKYEEEKNEYVFK